MQLQQHPPTDQQPAQTAPIVVVEEKHPHRPHRVTADEKFEKNRPDPDMVSTLRWAAVRALAGLLSGFLISGTVGTFTLLSIVVSGLVAVVFTLLQFIRLNALKDDSNRFLIKVELLTVLIAANIGAHLETLIHVARFLGGI